MAQTTIYADHATISQFGRIFHDVNRSRVIDEARHSFPVQAPYEILNYHILSRDGCDVTAF